MNIATVLFCLFVFLNTPYLEIVFLVDGEAVREHVACHDHVGLIAVHGKPVHPQELGQQCVPVALHDELAKRVRKRKEKHTS